VPLEQGHKPREVLTVVVDVLLDLIQEDTVPPGEKIQSARLLHEIVLKSGPLLDGSTVPEERGEEERETGPVELRTA